jgi:glycosyltransferase involved in cell wall biosynthesis
LETFCIGALEAQAAKNHMVTSNLAALNETAKDGVLIPFGHPKYNDFFIQAATNALLQSAGALYPQYDIQEYNLEEIAKNWIDLIRKI